MGKIKKEFTSVIEYLESEVKVEVLLVVDHWNDAFGGGIGLRFDWESGDVGFEEGGVPGGKVVVRWMVDEGIHGGANDGGGKTDDEDWGDEWTKEGGGWVTILGFFKWNDPFAII